MPLAGEGLAEPARCRSRGRRSGSVAGGSASSTSRAPLWSLIWPSVSSRMMGWPSPSQTAWSLEFSPPLVRPMRRGTAPF